MGPIDFSIYDGDENSSNAETNEVDSSRQTNGVEMKDSQTKGVEMKDSQTNGVEMKDSQTNGVEMKDSQTNGAEIEDSQTPISEKETDKLLKDKLKDEEILPPCYPGLPHYLVPFSVQCEINPNLYEVLRKNREERDRKKREDERYRKEREEAERNRREQKEVERFRKEREERNRRKLEDARNELNSEAPPLPPRSQKLMKAPTVSNPRVGQVRARFSPKTVRFANQSSDIESSNRWDYNNIIFVCLFVGCTAIVLLLATLVIIFALKL